MKGFGRAAGFAAFVLAIGALAVRPGTSRIVGLEDGPTGPGVVVGPSTGPSAGPAGPTGPTRIEGPTDGGPQCTRSKNGGATDVGVTADSIYLASTVVQSGPGSSFLGSSPFGLRAVVSKVNRAGGICGRILKLKLVDDGWDKSRGLSFIKTFIAERNFAMPVVPSSEGLTAAIEAGAIDKAGIPVVGSDGMLRQQYSSPWVWPVATATVSTMRIMAKYGYDKGARCFGIVYDTRYRFGSEGAEAFRSYVKTLPKAKICSDVGIFPARASYSAEIQRFNSGCGGKCDFVAMLLEPQTALTWIAGHPQFGNLITSGAQTLFNESFAANCGKSCNGMLLWTGYNPPIGHLAGLKDVSTYVNDVKTINPTIDPTNQFLEGSYLGMTIFVEALKAVGPNLTRAALSRVLNSQTFISDIATKLRWSTSDRHANKAAQAFSIVVAQGSFAGFQNKQTGFLPDPKL